VRECGAVSDIGRREVLGLVVNLRVVSAGGSERNALAVRGRVSVEEERGAALRGEVRDVDLDCRVA
jgi:hypothetical protein